MNPIQLVEQAFANEKVASYPKFKAGDTITVTYRIKEPRCKIEALETLMKGGGRRAQGTAAHY